MNADDYLVWEGAQAEKHEFFRGEVFAGLDQFTGTDDVAGA